MTASNDGIGDELLLGAGLLAALGLAGVGIAAARRRSRRRGDVVAYEEPAYVEPAAVAQRDLVPPTREPIYNPPVAAPATVAPNRAWTSPAAFTMPATVPSDVNQRRALIDRMVAAEPDEANPFKTRKARMRRARLILASREAQASQTPAERVAPRTVEPVRTREFETV